MRLPSRSSILIPVAAMAALAAFGIQPSQAQPEAVILEPGEARRQLERASRAGEEAERRAARFTAEAENAGEAAGRTAREAAALAARIQASEASIEIAAARYALAQAARARLSRDLAEREEPLVRLTAALQTNARRPLLLSALQPGSLKELVYVRAVLDSAIPEIRSRTGVLRGQLEQRRLLERRASRALASLRTSERELRERRNALAALEARQRLAVRAASADASRERERALALAESTRDLDGLVEQLDENAALRRELAALPGPLPRPSDPLSASLAPEVEPGEPIEAGAATALRDFRLPVDGRIVTGFGARRESGIPARGLVLDAGSGAQVVAPARGRIAFAGAYDGFGEIVIIEHPDGWTSVVTGLARSDVEIGSELIAGAPIGRAGARGNPIGIELRREGEPVNPLDFL